MAEIVSNPKARRDYQVIETYEAGIALRGTEVKSIRAGFVQIGDAFARVERNEVWLHNMHIEEYSHGNRANHVPKAPRKLLLHRTEIRKLHEFSAVKGNALVALSLHWKDGRVKVALAVGKSKAAFDKRQDIKRRDDDREMKRELAHRLKGR
ncbi:MAG: SsrA-binding protein [Pedosphaera sp. Tous-C6FEB]|nr:MAG: SsrA-binding protein [Pedosphaera sp. Tous-C6FEB]